jgi:uncharacterized BrkB/YihY/UPF0761 family membrane protein
MKWTPLWSDPVGWSEKVAKTKCRVFIWALIHLCFVSFGLVAIYWLQQKVYEFPDEFRDRASLYAVLAGAWPILFIGVGFPAMYLYAMYRMLTMLKAQKQTSPDDGEHKDDSPKHAA